MLEVQKDIYQTIDGSSDRADFPQNLYFWQNYTSAGSGDRR